MNKIEYAKFQFMILVLRALFMFLLHLETLYKETAPIQELQKDIFVHKKFLEIFMEEK